MTKLLSDLKWESLETRRILKGTGDGDKASLWFEMGDIRNQEADPQIVFDVQDSSWTSWNPYEPIPRSQHKIKLTSQPEVHQASNQSWRIQELIFSCIHQRMG